MDLTLKLNNQLALALNDLKEKVVVDGIEYQFDVSTFKKNGETVVIQVTVDGFEDGDWDEELTNVYHIGEEINTKRDPWVQKILSILLK